MLSDFSHTSSDVSSYLDLSEATADELESQVQRARAELAALQERQNQIEKEKKYLEELTKQQEALEQGKADIVDKLNRALNNIEASVKVTEHRLGQLNGIRKAFKEHLQGIMDIDPRDWSSNDLPKELNRALSLVENARSEYSLVRPKFMYELNEHTTDFEGALVGNRKDVNEFEIKGFVYWLKCGFALTLPLILFGILTLIGILWMLGWKLR